jgi:hypothetical protein
MATGASSPDAGAVRITPSLGIEAGLVCVLAAIITAANKTGMV